MSCCCENIYDLGCHNPCSPLQLPALSLSADDYTLELDGVQITSVEQAQVMGDLFKFNVATMLQNYKFQMKVFKAGQRVSFTDSDGKVWDCFSVVFTIGGQPAAATAELIPSA